MDQKRNQPNTPPARSRNHANYYGDAEKSSIRRSSHENGRGSQNYRAGRASSGTYRKSSQQTTHSSGANKNVGIHPTAVRQENSRGLVRQSRRQEIAERKEEKWQKDIVRVRGGIDVIMLTIILVLLCLGTATVFSASYPYAIARGEPGNTYIMSQIRFVILGLVAMVVMIFMPMKLYKSWAPIFAYLLSAGLLVYTALKGNAEGEARRWISIGGVFNLQPSELMKISLILIIAWYCDKYHKQMNEFGLGLRSFKWNTFFPCVLLGVGAGLVLIGKHLSGTIIVAAIGFFMLVVAGCKLSWIMAFGLPLGGAAIGAFLALNPYALKRITTFTDENADTLSDLYQTTQSIYAIGSGGLFGVGIGQSRQKYSFLTQAHTDFIFSIWCEECGFIGAVLLIALFLLFIWRGYVIAVKAPNKFSMLVAFGITTHVGLQAFLNMCVASDIIMNTGITLPFFSYGGSSLVVLMIEMGILLSISRQYYRKRSDIEREELLREAGLD